PLDLEDVVEDVADLDPDRILARLEGGGGLLRRGRRGGGRRGLGGRGRFSRRGRRLRRGIARHGFGRRFGRQVRNGRQGRCLGLAEGLRSGRLQGGLVRRSLQG